MSNGIAKEVKVKLKPVEAISHTDFSAVGGTVYTYELPYTDNIINVAIAGVDLTEDTTVVAADPDLADSTWAQFNNVLYIGYNSWGFGNRKIIVTYELYFSETGVYDYRNIETSDGGTVFYAPYLIKRPLFEETLTSDSFGFIPSATTNITIAHNGLAGRLDHWFRNKQCIIYDTTTTTITYKMIMTGSLSVSMPNVDIQIADQRELFNNESLEIVGEKYFGTSNYYFVGVKTGFGSVVLDGYDTTLNGQAMPSYLGLISGVRAYNVAYTPGEIPVNHGSSTTENNKDYFNNSVYWVPNTNYYSNANIISTINSSAIYKDSAFVRSDVSSSTRIYVENASNLSDLFTAGDSLQIQHKNGDIYPTVSSVGTDYIDVTSSVTTWQGAYILNNTDWTSRGYFELTAQINIGATTGSISSTEGVYHGSQFYYNSVAYTITGLDRSANTITFTPSAADTIPNTQKLLAYPYSGVILIKNGNRIELNGSHLFLSGGGVKHCNAGGTTLDEPDNYGLGLIIVLDWQQITSDFGFTLDGSEEVYLSGSFGSLSGSSYVNDVAGQPIVTMPTINGNVVHPRNYNSQNYNRTWSPSHAGWLLYFYMRQYVGIDEDDINENSFLTIDTIDYGVQLSGGRLHRDVINEILQECMLRMFINASGKWELAKVTAMTTADHTISDFLNIKQKYNSNETYGRMHIKYKEGAETYNLYTYDVQTTKDAIDENRILQLNTNFISSHAPTLMAPRYAAVHGYKKGRTELTVSKAYNNVLINDIVQVNDDMFDGGSKNFVVIAIKRGDESVILTLDDQLGVEENSSDFDVDDGFEGEV